MSHCEVRNGFGRRRFLSGILPVCAASCFGIQSAFAMGRTQRESYEPESKHRFDEDLGRTFTHRQFFSMRYREYIELTKALKEELGEKKAIDFLTGYTRKNMLEFGRNHADRSPDNSFHTYTDTFRDVNRYKNSLVMEIVEDTEKAFELKMTECLWASTFRDQDAGDIGYASVCAGDYTWATGFNPKIKLVRDKTLMQGHDICNHRYVWEG